MLQAFEMTRPGDTNSKEGSDSPPPALPPQTSPFILQNVLTGHVGKMLIYAGWLKWEDFEMKNSTIRL